MTQDEATVETGDAIIRFFEGSGTDRAGRSLDALLALDHDWLEVDHSHIQWLFPTPEKSSFSYFAPRLTAETIASFRASPALQSQLRRAFVFILDFYGLELSPGPPMAVSEMSTFSHRARGWVTDGNHNYLRISRVLRCLQVLGLETEARAFLAYLEDLYARRGDTIGPRTLEYWRRRARGDASEVPYRVIGEVEGDSM